MQAWPKEEEHTADEESVLSGKTRGRRKPKDELSEDVRYVPKAALLSSLTTIFNLCEDMAHEWVSLCSPQCDANTPI